MCQEEKTNGKLAIPLGAATERASMYTGVSQSSIFKFQKNDSESQEERMPCTDRVDLDDFDIGVVRRTFHDLIVRNHIVTTVFTLKVLVYFVYFQFCVSDPSAKIVILSRIPNVDISS